MTTYGSVSERENDRLLAACREKDEKIARLEAELERCKRAVEWMKDQIRGHNSGCATECCNRGERCAPYIGRGLQCPDCPQDDRIDLNVPAEFADIIKPAAGGDGT